jgi:hypothetical protein
MDGTSGFQTVVLFVGAYQRLGRGDQFGAVEQRNVVANAKRAFAENGATGTGSGED